MQLNEGSSKSGLRILKQAFYGLSCSPIVSFSERPQNLRNFSCDDFPHFLLERCRAEIGRSASTGTARREAPRPTALGCGPRAQGTHGTLPHSVQGGTIRGGRRLTHIATAEVG